LVLGGTSLLLDDMTNGYACESLDIGYGVRDVVDNVPDGDGAIDRTQYLGPRTVTIAIHAVENASPTQIDAIPRRFAPFMAPSARPELHYVLDDGNISEISGITPERMLVVRGADFAWPIVGPYERQIQLQFVAANPVAVDPNTYAETIAFAGATGTSGRTYNRTFPQTYPLGGGSASTGIVESGGDLPVRPLLTIYGPVKQPTITFNRESDNATVGVIPFVSGYIIPAGSYVVVDTAAHTAYLNGNKAQPVLSSINWANLVWPVIPVLPDGANMIFTADPSGGVSTGATQCQANWWDSFLV
jgi:hypothetical protein